VDRTFNTCLVPLWIEDFTPLMDRLAALRASGVDDVPAWITDHPEFFGEAVGLIRVVRVNPATLRLYNAPTEEALLEGLPKIFVPESLALFSQEVLALARGETTFTGEAMTRALDGRRVDILLSLSVPDDPLDFSRVVVSTTDITARVAAEEALRRATAQHEDFFHNGPDLYLAVDVATRTVADVNARAVRSLGYSREALVGKPLMDLYDPSCHAAARQTLSTLMTEARIDGVELTVRRADGSTFPVELSATAERDAAGRVVRTRSSWRDISDRERISQLMLIEQAMESAPLGQILVDSDGGIAMINRRAEELFGASRRSLLGQSIEALIPASARARHQAHRGAYARNLEARTMGRGAQLYGRHADGSEFPVEVAVGPVPTNRGSWYLASITDITERLAAVERQRQFEAQLQQAQKLESLGLLAGGIAHDFNNLLVSILGYADLALIQLPRLSPARPLLASFKTGGQRAAELCNQMLAYSGRGAFIIEKIDLGVLLGEMSHLLEVAITRTAVVKYELADNLPAVEADAAQIRQIAMNLIVNAAEAIGDRSGIISVRTGTTWCDRDYLETVLISGDGLTRGAYVFLEVSDTGCGMDAEMLGRIFDPFYTTKFTGRGLGLSAVMGIVRGHGGALAVDSAPGRGSTFRVLLPVAVGEATPSAVDPEVPEHPSSTGTILLVDDEESVRSVGRLMLEHAGFSVLTAEDGCEGVELYQRHMAEISVVLLDLTMPQMDGEEAFRHLRAMDPDAQIILTSGYNAQDIEARFADGGLAGFVKKPYSVAQLVSEVMRVCRDALDPTDPKTASS